MKRRLMIINPVAQCWRLETLETEVLQKDPREDYFVLSGLHAVSLRIGRLRLRCLGRSIE